MGTLSADARLVSVLLPKVVDAMRLGRANFHLHQGATTMHAYANVVKTVTGLATVAALIGGCAVESSKPTPAPRADAPAQRPAQTKIDTAQGERIRRIMVPLIAAMNKPLDLKQVKMGVMDDPSINAANAGNGEFFVTTGLLQKAHDAQLTGILAHEVAHEDLGHVAKAQALGAGLNIGMVILDQLIPGSGALTPIAGTLVARAYSRNEEYAADKHGAELLERTGQSKQLMIDTLTWLMQTSGSDSGGFFATHPGTEDRIDALRKVSAR
jgi:Zn-dependent protease with chaperone function